MIDNDNQEFELLAKDILENDKFKILKNDNHHGTNKYDHCKRVAYVSYKLAKFFNCDYQSIVRPALLHDFFFGERTEKEENNYLSHQYTSAENAKHYFNISENEEEIIKTHMFHFALMRTVFPFIDLKQKPNLKKNTPKSKEAWIVCLADLIVSTKEFSTFKIGYSAAVLLLFCINLITINK